MRMSVNGCSRTHFRGLLWHWITDFLLEFYWTSDMRIERKRRGSSQHLHHSNYGCWTSSSISTWHRVGSNALCVLSDRYTLYSIFQFLGRVLHPYFSDRLGIRLFFISIRSDASGNLLNRIPLLYSIGFGLGSVKMTKKFQILLKKFTFGGFGDNFVQLQPILHPFLNLYHRHHDILFTLFYVVKTNFTRCDNWIEWVWCIIGTSPTPTILSCS